MVSVDALDRGAGNPGQARSCLHETSSETKRLAARGRTEFAVNSSDFIYYKSECLFHRPTSLSFLPGADDVFAWACMPNRQLDPSSGVEPVPWKLQSLGLKSTGSMPA